jgi:hypothetical protein
MKAEGLEKLDDFLLDCAEISQDEREEIMEFVNRLIDENEKEPSTCYNFW